MNIIDARCLPPYGSLVKDSTFFNNIPVRKQCAEWKYNKKMAPSAIAGDMDMLIAEMDECGIEKAFAPAYFGLYAKLENSDMAKFVETYKGRFLGFCGAYPDDPNTLAELKEYVVDGPCTGAVAEPGWGPNAMPVNDKRMYPIYEFCEENNIPMMIGFGGMLHNTIDIYKPEYLSQVLRDFPELRMLALHGGWPYVQEMCYLALMHKGLYITPDIYATGAPGSRAYGEGANTVIKDKIVFASAYPIISQAEAIQAHKEIGIKEENYERVFHRNALQFLGEVQTEGYVATEAKVK